MLPLRPLAGCALGLLLAGCAYTVPLDPAAPDVLNALSGEVVVTGTTEVAPTFVLLTDAADPPPPAGTGAPSDFGSVPASAYTGLSSTGEGGGVQSAPWSLTHVPDGAWILSALLDMDENFQPFLTSNAGATCGDWVGAHLSDIASGTVGTVQVEGGTLLDDVTIVVGVEMTTQAPAFTIEPFQADQTLPATSFQTFVLDSVSVATDELTLPGPFDGTDPCDTAFLEVAVDADGDGAVDPHPNPALAAGGALDVWPRIYLRYLGTPLADGSGYDSGLADGESWAAESVIFPAGLPPANTPTLVTSLRAVWIPGAIHTRADGTEEQVAAPDLPEGVWGVTVVESTGQTWTLPNNLAGSVSLSADFDPASQATAVVVGHGG